MHPVDFTSSAWKRYMKHQEARLAELRDLNDNPSLTELKTAEIRGQIAEVKRSLTLEQSSASKEAQPGESWPAQAAE